MQLFFFVNEKIKHPETRDVVLWPGCYEPLYILARAQECGIDFINGVTIVANNIDEAMQMFDNQK